VIRDRLDLRPVDMTAEEVVKQLARSKGFVQRCLEEVERDAADPSRVVRFIDLENPEAGMESGAEGSESPGRVQRDYEIRDKRDSKEGRPSIEAWLPGWHWPVVRALESAGTVAHAGTWLVLTDPKVAELAGLRSTDVAAADVVNVANALQWVAMLAALYVKAAAK
jgi:hypothetical protein